MKISSPRSLLFTSSLFAALSIGGGAQALKIDGKSCGGVFTLDSQGKQFSEGGLEPTADKRKRGARGTFLGFDVVNGARYYLLEGGDLHAARGVKLDARCKLGKIKQY